MATKAKSSTSIVNIKGWRLREKIPYIDPETGKTAYMYAYQKLKKETASRSELAKHKCVIAEKEEEIKKIIADGEKKKFKADNNIKDFNNMFLDWYDAFVKRKQIIGTQQNWMRQYRYHIEKQFAGKQIDEIDSLFVQKIFNCYDDDGYCVDTQKAIYAYLNKFFTYCQNEGWIMRNPMYNVIKPDGEKKEKRALTQKEMKIIVTQIKSSKTLMPYHKLGCLIAANEALRCEEILGITLEHYDRKTQTLKVWRTVVDLKEGDIRLYISDKMKSKASRRVIKLMPSTAAAINKYIMEHPPFKKHTDGYTYLFQNAEGSPMSPRNLGAAWYKILFTLKKNKAVPADCHTSIHGVRKYWTTLLKQMGVPTETIARKMGHDPNTSNSSYTDADAIIIDITTHQQIIMGE